MKQFYLTLATAAFLVFSSCVKDTEVITIQSYTNDDYAVVTKALNLPAEPFDYTLQLPNHLGGFPITVDKHQATLGRVLFYDKRLSSSKEISCASCHKADKAFADNAAFSQGVTTERTSRNSLALGVFPSFSGHYNSGGSLLFWDERAKSVADQSRQSLLNPVEMGVEDIGQVVRDILQEKYYQILFEKAFPKNDFMSDEDKMLLALEAFVNSIGCFQTKYDQGHTFSTSPNLPFSNFTALENQGKELFNQHCIGCHNLNTGFGPSAVNIANNGLDMNYEDKGVGGITQRSEDMGLFKVPMLRNVGLTAPYMHDGRFATLEEVVEHYNSGIKNHPNLHPLLKNGNQARQLNLTTEEKSALVTFLKTLTDEESLSHVRFSNPFK